jgi:hypothetical protein
MGPGIGKTGSDRIEIIELDRIVYSDTIRSNMSKIKGQSIRSNIIEIKGSVHTIRSNIVFISPLLDPIQYDFSFLHADL